LSVVIASSPIPYRSGPTQVLRVERATLVNSDRGSGPAAGAEGEHVYFETAFSSARTWSIWSYAYVTIAVVVIVSPLRASDSYAHQSVEYLEDGELVGVI